MNIQDVKAKKKKTKPTPEAINPALSFESTESPLTPLEQKLHEGWEDFKEKEPALKTIPHRHGKLTVDRTKPGVTKVSRQNYQDNYQPSQTKSKGQRYIRGLSHHAPHPTDFSRTNTDRDAGRSGPFNFMRPKIGTLESQDIDENLKKWFKEKWVRFGPDGKIRGECGGRSEGEGKPKCLPASKAHSLGKKGRASAAARKRREDPNPERSGAAINVATKKKTTEGQEYCPECGGSMYPESMINEKKDACYYKVKSRYKVWPSAYASGALVRCRKKGAKSWGSKSKNESVDESQLDEKWSEKYKRSINCANPRGFSQRAHCQGRKKNEDVIAEAMARKSADEIRRIQQMLNVKHGANLDVDGVLGPLTIRSIKKFLPAAKQKKAPTPGQTPAVQGKKQKKKLDEKCWDTHRQVGMKKKGSRMVPNCVPKEGAVNTNSKSESMHEGGFDIPEIPRAPQPQPAPKPNPQEVPVKEGAPNFKSKQEVINYFVSKGKSAASGAAAWERGWRGPKQQKSFKSTKSLPKQQYWWQDRDLDESNTAQEGRVIDADQPVDVYVSGKNRKGQAIRALVAKDLPNRQVSAFSKAIEKKHGINPLSVVAGPRRKVAEDQDNPFVVYVNNRPVGKFDTLEEAKQAAEMLYQREPKAYIDTRKTQCTETLMKTIAENENLYI